MLLSLDMTITKKKKKKKKKKPTTKCHVSACIGTFFVTKKGGNLFVEVMWS
jgi:hypothetical protein